MSLLLAPLSRSVASLDAGLLLLASCLVALGVLLVRLRTASRRER